RVGRPFDLVGRGGDAPDEAFGELLAVGLPVHELPPAGVERNGWEFNAEPAPETWRRGQPAAGGVAGAEPLAVCARCPAPGPFAAAAARSFIRVVRWPSAS